MRTRALLIVTAPLRDAANAAAIQVAGPYATDTFSVPLYQGLAKVPTHYAACWSMENVDLAEFRQAIAQYLSGGKVQVFAGVNVRAKLGELSLNAKAKEALGL